MLPATMTIASIFTAAKDVVGEFGSLIALVVGIGFGVWGVKFLIAKLRGAK